MRETGNRASVETGNLLRFSRTDEWRAEILWAMKTVEAGYSYKSCENAGKLFSTMFPDSSIASKFTCGEKKCAYVVCFGLAPHFKSELLKNLNRSDTFVILFDESLNFKTQNKQMDFFVRFFDKTKRLIVTRYYDSAFIGHGRAVDMVKHFLDVTKDLDLKKMVQISMDGPNVNWAFFDEIMAELKKDDSCPRPLNIGSCGLHIVHGVFKTAMTAVDWDVQGLLKAMFILFKDTPARREDYESITGSRMYALKYCATRWTENVPVALRAIEILPHFKTYVERVLREPKKYTVPKTQSFATIKSAVKDHLTVPKLNFFVSFAEEFLPFLTKYQTDAPMTPFLATDLEHVLRNLMGRVVKTTFLSDAVSITALLKVDVEKSDNQKPIKEIDIGFIASKKLKELIAVEQVSKRDALNFRMDALAVIKSAVSKFIYKSPLNYSVTRNLACLVPYKMASEPDKSMARFTRLLTSLVHVNRIEEKVCDQLIRLYQSFLTDIVRPNQTDFRSFDPQQCRLDTMLHKYVGQNSEYDQLWKLIKVLLSLSHGQASVKRGFSVNKYLVVDNMREKTVIAQRIVHDHIQSHGGVLEVPMEPELLKAAQAGRQRYMMYLEEEKERKATDEMNRKRPALSDAIADCNAKRARLEAEIMDLEESADSFAEKAEAQGNIVFLTKSNCMRNRAKEKKLLIVDIDAEIRRLKKE